MGSFSYGPKQYNSNWSLYSTKRKKWEATHKKKETPRNNNKTTKNSKKNQNK